MNKFMKIIGAVAVINIVARLFGFLREVAIADEYGTTDPANAIITAYTIPNFIYLVVGGALTTAFISVYHSSKSDKGNTSGRLSEQFSLQPLELQSFYFC